MEELEGLIQEEGVILGTVDRGELIFQSIDGRTSVSDILDHSSDRSTRRE